MAPPKKFRLGDQLVEQGLLTAEQLKEALILQDRKDLKLGEAIVAAGFLTEQQIEEFLATKKKKLRIGDLLVEKGHVSEQQLMRAIAEQKRTGKKLGEAVVELGYITEFDFLKFLAGQLGMAFIELKNYRVDEKTSQLIPENQAKRFHAVALRETEDEVLVGMADPTDIFALDELARYIVDKDIKPALISAGELEKNLDRFYRKSGEIQSIAEEMREEVEEDTSEIDLQTMMQSEVVVDAPVVKILQSLFEDAVRMKASDIHIEPDEEVLRIRQRVDGVLYEQVINEKQIAPALVSKVKLMAGLEIAERRRPQDGRFNMTINQKNIDIRVSTLPIQDGESVVMRLLDQSGGILGLKQVGLPPRVVQRIEGLISRPHGIVLVTGPTGSGKTTTLYAALSEINEPGKKIITVEDPVEYRLERVNQVQVRTKIGLDFATVLRTMLRQDPDIILVGEMRDQETADIAIRAALTGHLVFSTLHTNDAVGTAVRLLEMGIPGYAVASALLGVISQRLVRRICRHCAAPDVLDPQRQAWLASMAGNRSRPMRLRRGRGCVQCNHTGYAGRIAVVELLEINAGLAEALRREDTDALGRLALKTKGFRPLRLAALDYAMQGITTVDEAIRLSNEIFDEAEEPVEAVEEAASAEAKTAPPQKAG